MKPRTLRRIAIGVIIVIVAFVLYDRFASPYTVMADGQAALVSTDQVTVRTEPYLVFEPIGEQATAGLVFYVGARVPPAAYAPLARQIASQGYLVAIPTVPFNLAFFGQSKANEVFEDHPEIVSWAVGGHSLGGAMAASYADRTSRVKGLLLLAAYPGSNTDLRQRAGMAVSIVYGSEDELATPEEVEGAAGRLSGDTEFVLIEGGNHAQFGWYGTQSGDGAATIPRIEQQAQVVEVAVDLMRRIDR